MVAPEIDDEILDAYRRTYALLDRLPADERVALRGDALIGIALPAPVIKVKGQEVASFGTPTVLFAAALEVRP